MECNHNFHLIKFNGFRVYVCRKCGKERNFEQLKITS